MNRRVFALVVFLISNSAIAETFNVGLTILPNFNPITNQVNVANYIGIHIYNPLFKMDSNGALASDFLDIQNSKSLDTSFLRYRFCLKESIHFSDGTDITPNDLLASLRKFSAVYPYLLPISKIATIPSTSCVSIELVSSTPNLFKKLTGIASTVLKEKDVDKNYPTGFGPYRVSFSSSNRLVLEANTASKFRFNKIVFTLVKNIKSVTVEDFHDLNQLPPTDQLFTDKNLKRVNAPTLKVYSFIFNLKQKVTRELASCLLFKFDIKDGFGLDLIPHRNFLPLVSSDRLETTPKKCTKVKTKIPLLIPDIYSLKNVERVLVSYGALEQFNLLSLSTTKFADWVFSGKEYVALMSFDSSGSISSLEGDFSVYFESFFAKENRIVSNPLVQISEIIKKAASAVTTPVERRHLMTKAENFLFEEHYILPVGKVRRDFYFPKTIEVGRWADFYSGFPQINEIR